MSKDIPADKLIAEIKREIESNSKNVKPGSTDYKSVYCRGAVSALYTVKNSIIPLLQEQPEYGHFVSYYITGKKPIFNVGDILAYYVCTSNEEGERNIGKIEKVVFDEEEDGWVYTFENGDAYSEEELVMDDFYKKN